MAAPKRIDYDRIESGWRAGLLSPHQLAAKYTEDTGQKVSHAAIIKHFRKAGITRDLSSKIQDRAEAMVTEAMVTGKVTAKPSIPDAAIIEAGSMQVAEVKLAHRSDIHRARRLTNALLNELEQETDPRTLALLRDLGDMMRVPDERGNDKLNDLYQTIIGLPERSKTMKVLAESLQKLVDMERTAFGMDAKEQAQPGQPGFVPLSVAVAFVDPPKRPPEDDDE
ncbi:hypothetical protein [Lampropedia aestuarii]|uniref:hypothetical protein n=1 Tax=Lampropedia aestuarii TaxID=2562762 RepID=UPI0024698BB8|nr:hypothetical protein [Lampropedia aestuarii]MDH5857790.1 hypothetical protein [Lampropedia aestuarii]